MKGRTARLSSARGASIVVFALVLPLLLAFVALVVDIGHFLQVRSQLQNAADAAALAGARDLDGTMAKLATARLAARYYAGEHVANGTPLSLDLNPNNDVAGDIVLGTWSFAQRVFTPAVAASMPSTINAVKVYGRRTAGRGGAVRAYFAPLFGFAEKDLTVQAVAVGGGPSAACGFPLVLPDCAILDSAGQVRCNSTMTFGRATMDNVGFTLLLPSPPVNTPGINCEIMNALGSPQCHSHGSCDCAKACNPTAMSGGAIYVSNGNNLSNDAVDAINQAVAQAGAKGLFVQVPVLDSGGLEPGACGGFQFNRLQAIAGYANMRIVSADKGPPKTIQVSVDCTMTTDKSPGGGFFGYRSTQVMLTQ